MQQVRVLEFEMLESRNGSARILETLNDDEEKEEATY